MSILNDQFIHLDFFIKCTIAILLGCIIGYERQSKKKPAGIKTHALISLGAAIITFLSHNFSDYGDPSRIAAQIVSGIGFIGAGTIFISRQRIQGLTSAATVWVSASIGMLIGSDYIMLSIIAVSLITLLFYSIRPKTHTLTRNYSINIQILDWESLETISDMMEKFQLTVIFKSLERKAPKDGLYLSINYSTTPMAQHLFLNKLFQLKGLGHILKI